MVPNEALNPVCEAAVQATEKPILNALVAAEAMAGYNGHRVVALSHDRRRELLQKYNRFR